MKKIFLIVSILFCTFFSNANEPFVVLEYKGHTSNRSGKINIDKNNKFLKDSNYSLIHKVKPGESLSGILQKHYGKTGLNMKIIEVSVIEINKHAFVRQNPHFLYAGKKIKIPSLNEIMNLVRDTPKKVSGSEAGKKSHIYFYGN